MNARWLLLALLLAGLTGPAARGDETRSPGTDEAAEVPVALEGTLKIHPKFLYKYYLADFGGGQTCALFGAEELQNIPVGSGIRVEGRLGTRFHPGGDAQNLSPFPRTWYIYMDVATVKVLREPAATPSQPPPRD